MGRLRNVLIVAVLTIAACGSTDTDPYALLDRAWTAGWDRVQVQLGVVMEVPSEGGVVLGQPGNIHIDPADIAAIVDTHTGQWRLRVSIPNDAVGSGLAGLLGPAIQSVDAEVLFDGTDLFAKSPLLPMWLQTATPPLVEGDLTGWVRLGSTADLGAIVDPANPAARLPIAAALPGLGAMPLPTPGSPATLRQFFEDLGVVAEYKGTEQRIGREARHVAAGLDIVKLARNDRFAQVLGWGREEQQSMSDNARQFAVSSDLWFDKESGRLVSFALNFQTLQAPVTHLGATVLLSEPTIADPFAAPGTWTDVPLQHLLGLDSLGGSEGSGGSNLVTPAPLMP